MDYPKCCLICRSEYKKANDHIEFCYKIARQTARGRMVLESHPSPVGGFSFPRRD